MTLGGITSLASSTTSNYSAVYYLKDVDLPTTTGSRNIVITKTFSGESPGNSISPDEYVEIVGVNTFTNVDQINSTQFTTTTSTTASITSPAINNLRVGDILYSATINNNPSATGNMSPVGAIEAFENTSANTGGLTTGINYQTQYTAITNPSTSSITNTTSSGRMAMVAFSVQSYRVYDNSVVLLTNGLPGGNNLALSNTFSNAWLNNDIIISYGDINSNTWGTPLTYADINNPNFGVSFQATAFNSTAMVDHIKITVQYAVSMGISFISNNNTTNTEVSNELILNLSNDDFIYTLESNEEIKQVELWDVKGNKYMVNFKSVSDYKCTFEASNSAGMYILSIRFSDKMVSKYFIIMER